MNEKTKMDSPKTVKVHSLQVLLLALLAGNRQPRKHSFYQGKSPLNKNHLAMIQLQHAIFICATIKSGTTTVSNCQLWQSSTPIVHGTHKTHFCGPPRTSYLGQPY